MAPQQFVVLGSNVVALFCIVMGCSCQAFTTAPLTRPQTSYPTFIFSEHVRGRRKRQSALPQSNNNNNEFDFILREEGPNSNGQSHQQLNGRRSRFAVELGGTRDGSKKVVLASTSAAVPNTAAQAAEALSELEQGQQQQSATSPSDQLDGTSDDPYDNAFDAQMNKIQQYQEQQQTTTLASRFKSMDLQDIIVTLILPSIAAFAAFRWGYNRISERVTDKTDSLLTSFANEMIYHDGDFEEMKMCIDDYSKRLVYLGPTKRDKMLKSYLADYAKRKTISPQAIASLSYVFAQFSLSEEAAANLLVSLCRALGTDKISSAGKLLFLGSRILKSPEGVQALKPIKELIKSTYRDTDATVAETMMETSQQAMAEASYRHAVLSAGKNQSKLTDGWQVLGLSEDVATRIWKEEKKEGFVSEREAMYGGQTRKYDKKGRQIDDEGNLANPEEAEEDDDDSGDEPVSNVYECGECGFTLFVAEGRESKFFGSDFKCPECGAPKEKFQARDDFGE